MGIAAYTTAAYGANDQENEAAGPKPTANVSRKISQEQFRHDRAILLQQGSFFCICVVHI